MRDDNSKFDVPGIELTDESLSTVSAGKFDSFLKLDGIKGETTDKGHKDWIEILSF
jgi:hypothetical protein